LLGYPVTAVTILYAGVGHLVRDCGWPIAVGELPVHGGLLLELCFLLIERVSEVVRQLSDRTEESDGEPERRNQFQLSPAGRGADAEPRSLNSLVEGGVRPRYPHVRRCPHSPEVRWTLCRTRRPPRSVNERCVAATPCTRRPDHGFPQRNRTGHNQAPRSA